MKTASPLRVAILGATGSIGDNTLDVLARQGDAFQVVLLTGHHNLKKLAEITARWQPQHVATSDPAKLTELRSQLHAMASPVPETHAGLAAISDLCASESIDVVVAGMVGSAGVEPVLAAAAAGKTILLANKESLVMAGDIVMRTARENNARIIPLDSEHNAIYQCLHDNYACGQAPESVQKLILTASGGPFWDWPAEDFARITPEQACNHPKWQMGPKISVDSATLMNKGLELIEAHWLFDVPASQLDVHVHPQSLVHSLVVYKDGSFLAQLGEPDMRIPIAYGLGQCLSTGQQPVRLASGAATLDLLSHGKLEFYPPDDEKFPSVQLARQAIEAGGIMAAALNASNEETVQAFLDRRISFPAIARINARVMETIHNQKVESFEHLQQVDVEVRAMTQNEIQIHA